VSTSPSISAVSMRTSATPAALEYLLKSETVRWGKIIKDAGITPQ
jgi:tripartite-type tricarboxylate transporter receptor subunit TctC